METLALLMLCIVGIPGALVAACCLVQYQGAADDAGAVAWFGAIAGALFFMTFTAYFGFRYAGTRTERDRLIAVISAAIFLILVVWIFLQTG